MTIKSHKKIKRTKVQSGISPVGWYLSSILLRFQWNLENKKNSKRRCIAWENDVIIKARSLKEAYIKALKVGRQEDGLKMWRRDEEDIKGKWKFEGLTRLIPIYENLEDGSEILWKEYSKSVGTIKRMIKTKRQLLNPKN